MTLEEIIKLLSTLENGAEAVADLDAIISTHETANNKLKADLKAMKESQKKDKATLDKANGLVEKLCSAIGVDEDDEDIDASIEKALKEKSADPALNKRIAKLEKKLTDTEANYKSQLEGEKTKRYDGMKRNALMESLVKNNAADPELLLDMLVGKMKVDDADESITFDDDKTPCVDDYVKHFLTAHPRLLKNMQSGGANSFGNGGDSPQGASGDNNVEIFAKNLAAGNANSAEQTAVLKNYFE